MADEIIIETTSAEVIEVGVPGPQGPAGAPGTGLETLTTQGDTLYRGAATGERLPIGTTGQILRVSASGIPEWGAAPASGVASVNGETGAVTLDGSDIDTSGNDDLAAFVTYEFADGNGIYYPLPDSTLNNKRVYRTTTGHHVFFQSLRWHITDGSPITANIIESSDDDNAAWPWLSAWDGSIEKAQLSTVVGRARSTFLFVGDNIPNTSVSGLATVAASGSYDDLTGKPASFTPSAHSSTHHTGGTDAIAPNNIGAAWAQVLSQQTISSNTLLAAGRNRRITLFAVGATANVDLPHENNQAGDVVTLVADWSVASTLTIRRAIVMSGGSPIAYSTLATLNASGQSFSFVSDGTATGWSLRPVDTHTHTFGTTAGTFTEGNDTRLSDTRDPNLHAASHAAAGSDPLAPSDIGAANASHTHDLDDLTRTGVAAGNIIVRNDNNDGWDVIDGASWAGLNISAGDIDAAASSHTHGNLTNDGKVGSTAGLPLVTTTAGAVSTLALGAAGTVLTVNSGANGVEFAAASGGVSAVNSTLADILSVSGSDLVADDLGADKLYGWDDSAGKAIGFTIGSGLSVSGDTLSATATGTIGGSTGQTDNVILRSNGTGGSTLQESGLIVEDVVRTFTTVTGDAAADTITITGSGFESGQRVRFTSLTGGSGLNTTTNYFVVNPSGDTFQVSTTLGGSPSLFTTNITAATLLTGATVVPHVAISISSPDTNSSLVLNAKGSGALLRGSGGNARGSVACDLQASRVADAQVASGQGSCIAGGQRNTASGPESFATNYENTSSGFYSFSCGQSNTSSSGATLATGLVTTASNEQSASFGLRSVADRVCTQAYASGRFAANGDAQRIRAVLRNKTTTNSAVELFMGADTNVRLTVPSGKVMAMLINITGAKSDGSAVAHYVRQYAIKNVGGTTSEVYAAATIGTDNAASTSITLSANDTNDALKIEVTGIASETWRWVASIDAVEVAYGT